MDDIFYEHRRLTQIDWDILTAEAYGIYVEVGTFHGASACAAAQKADVVHTIDIFDWQPKVFNSDKILFFKGTSVDFAVRDDAGATRLRDKIDVLFIDGSHEYDSVKKDCESLVPLVKKGGTVMFHDHNLLNQVTGVVAAVNEYIAKIPHQLFEKPAGSSNLLKIIKL